MTFGSFEEKREQIKTQIEQLTCFIDSCYGGMAHDIKIAWNFGGGKDSAGRETKQDVADYWREKYGKHEQITIGVGDAYYGSATLSHMLYEAAYHMRERLNDKLSEMATGKTRAEIEREAEEGKRRSKELADLARLKAKYEQNGTMTAPTPAHGTPSA